MKIVPKVQSLRKWSQEDWEFIAVRIKLLIKKTTIWVQTIWDENSGLHKNYQWALQVVHKEQEDWKGVRQRHLP